MLILSAPELKPGKKKDTIRLSVNIHEEERPLPYKDKTLWFELDNAFYKLLDTQTLDGPLIALLLLAMKQGKSIKLKAPVSKMLYSNLTEEIIPLLNRINPAVYKKIDLLAEAGFHDGSLFFNQAKGVITGFSGGVDSFYTLAEHYYGEATAEKPAITHLLFNNVGAHGQKGAAEDEQLFWKLFKNLEPFCTSVNLPFIAVNSNLDSILELDFIKTHTFRNVAVAYLLQNGIHHFYYATTHPDNAPASEEVLLKLSADYISYAEPLLLPMLCSEHLTCTGSGGAAPRPTKTQAISKIEGTYKYLTVCVEELVDGRNCSVCFKCERTLLTLDILGVLPLYADAFHLEKYYTRRPLFMAKLLSQPDLAFNAEILALAQEKQYRFSLPERGLACLLAALPQGGKEFLKQARHFKKRRSASKKGSTEVTGVEPATP